MHILGIHGLGQSNGVDIRGLEASTGDTDFPPGLDGWLILGNDNVLMNNIGSGSYGAFVTVGSNNLLMGNIAKDNFAGFVEFGTDNVFRNNLAVDNGNVGFGAGPATRAEYRGNVALRCDIGFLTQGGPGAPNVDTEFSNNMAIDSVVDGFNLAFSTGLKVRNNVVLGAVGSRDGIRLNDVFDSTFLNNVVGGAGNNGFSMDEALENPEYPGTGSVGNEFRNNESHGNDGYGFYVNPGTGSGHVYINNSCSGNGLGGSNLPGVCD